MKFKITLLIIAGWLVSSPFVKGQDMHFSQYYASPLTLNPALTGAFEGKYRLSAIYRNQWMSAFDRSAFKTIAAGLDIRFPVPRRDDAFAGGLSIFNDKVGFGSFTTTSVSMSGAYHKSLDMYETNILSAGFQMGITQRSFNIDPLTFSDQFNGIDGYTLGSGEIINGGNNFSFFDLAAGVFWRVQPQNARGSFHLGISGQHLTKPNVSFYRGELDPKKRMFMRLNAQMGGKIPLGDKTSHNALLARGAVSWQEAYMQVNTGLTMKLALNPYGDTALHFGGSLRTASAGSQFGVDAFTALLGLEYHGLMAGFSYDLNIGDLSGVGKKRTAFEFSLTFIGEYEDETVSCPTF